MAMFILGHVDVNWVLGGIASDFRYHVLVLRYYIKYVISGMFGVLL